MEPTKHKRHEKTAVVEVEAEPQDLQAIIQASIDKGDATLRDWEFALQEVKERSDLLRTRNNLTSIFPGPFAGTPVEKISRSIQLQSLTQEEGEDWRYDRTKAHSTFTFALKGQTFKVTIQTNYSESDGIDLTLRIERESNSKQIHAHPTSLVDCSGDYPHDFWANLWVDENDLITYLQQVGVLKAELSRRKKRFVRCMCWLFSALVACTAPAAQSLESKEVQKKVSAALQQILAK